VGLPRGALKAFITEYDTTETDDTMSTDPLTPTNRDDFESGDHRNFAPVYLGGEDDWIRPSLGVTDDDPISGDHSLRFDATDDPHEWAVVSNAFYLAPPLTLSASVRVDSPADETYRVGVGVAETAERAAVLGASPDGVALTTERWDDADATDDATLDPGAVYEFTLSLAEDGSLAGEVRRDGEQVAALDAATALDANAVGLYVETEAGGDAALTFDDVAVDAGPYRVPADEWVRSPSFVALPRRPDVGLDQGEWVGAATVVDEGDEEKLWYRIRNNDGRGAGYGLATSEDGVSWEKSDANPLFVPDYASNEGITVLQVDGTYHAWYTIDHDGNWHVCHATSEDGVEWDDDGIVVEGYCKDPSAVYVDGTYYLYAIAPRRTDLSVYTSDDGRDWTLESTIELGVHSHPEAYYVDETETFWLYAFAEEGREGVQSSVRRASSSDGIEFGPLADTWSDPPVGLDDRPNGGIDYGTFPGDGHGHLPHDRRLPMYYQARHNYDNNRPGWVYAGDGRVVLGGRFTGLFAGVPTTVEGDAYAYHAFPLHAASVADLDVAADGAVTVTVEDWGDDGGSGTLDADADTAVTVTVSGRDPGESVAVAVGDETTAVEADESGTAETTATVPGGETVAFSVGSAE
jgi:hypothetical protein